MNTFSLSTYMCEMATPTSVNMNEGTTMACCLFSVQDQSQASSQKMIPASHQSEEMMPIQAE